MDGFLFICFLIGCLTAAASLFVILLSAADDDPSGLLWSACTLTLGALLAVSALCGHNVIIARDASDKTKDCEQDGGKYVEDDKICVIAPEGSKIIIDGKEVGD